MKKERKIKKGELYNFLAPWNQMVSNNGLQFESGDVTSALLTFVDIVSIFNSYTALRLFGDFP